MEKKWAAYTFALCCAVLLYMLLSNISAIKEFFGSVWKILSPVVIGIIVAYLMNPLSDLFEFKLLSKLKSQKTKHLLSVILTVACLALILILLLFSLIPSLAKSVAKLISNWDNYVHNIQNLIQKIIAFTQDKGINIDLSFLSDTVDNAMDKLLTLIKDNSGAILGVLGNVGSSVSNFAVGIVFGVCFLVAEEKLKQILSKIRSAILPKDKLNKNNALWKRCNTVFIRYFVCTLVDAGIIGFGTLIFMLIMRLPYAPLIAAMCGITNIIPTFGPMIGAAVGIFFLILDNPLNALWFLIFICIWQSIDGMIIKPRLFKDSLGIPAVWTLVLIILGGKIARMMGILLAIPVAAILVIIYNETIAVKIDERIKRINNEELQSIDDQETSANTDSVS